MGKKRVKKITDQQYLQYIAGLREDEAALFDMNGELLVPDVFTHEERGE